MDSMDWWFYGHSWLINRLIELLVKRGGVEKLLSKGSSKVKIHHNWVSPKWMQNREHLRASLLEAFPFSWEGTPLILAKYDFLDSSDCSIRIAFLSSVGQHKTLNVMKKTLLFFSGYGRVCTQWIAFSLSIFFKRASYSAKSITLKVPQMH